MHAPSRAKERGGGGGVKVKRQAMSIQHADPTPSHVVAKRERRAATPNTLNQAATSGPTQQMNSGRMLRPLFPLPGHACYMAF
ncbi:hypothetical protein CGRA01v4_03161 [Colletotrichum graminicola]|nr:hypothetical protein CGRA01v4_03161 [Colletotrichum graminicola]